MDGITIGQFHLVYNAFSFTIAAMGAATVYFWLNRGEVSPNYRLAITISGLVTAIALYHYVRIFNSWEAAFVVNGDVVTPGRIGFNDAYRYVDWLLTVPLLLVELILVMRLTPDETRSRSWRLGLLAAAMIALGYPGEISADPGTRWIWWALACLPFAWIVYELFSGLSASISKQPDNVKGLVIQARNVTVLSWLFYPIVFILPMIGFKGFAATTAVQVGYTIADVVAKAVFGLLIFNIARRKSLDEGWQAQGRMQPAE